MRIYFLRHARTQVIDGDFYGSGLSPEGVAAAQELARSDLIPLPDAVFASPFRRAKETAEALCGQWQLDYTVVEDLAEWNLQARDIPGDAYTLQEELGWSDFSLVVAGNECLYDVAERGLGALQQIATTESVETVVAVAHGTIIDVVCARLAGRKAAIEDIRGMRYLDFAVIAAEGGKLSLEKDILASSPSRTSG